MATFSRNQIIEGASGSGVTIDGLLFKDKVPYTGFSFEMTNTTTQALTIGTNNLVGFDTVRWDTYGGVVDTANDRINIPVAGIYYFAFQTRLSPEHETIVLRWYLNGSLHKNIYIQTKTLAEKCRPYVELMTLDVSDYIQIFIFPFGTTTIGSSTDQVSESRIQGFFVGV
jgi:hypothetical protein